MQRFTRIGKREAFQRFCNGDPIYLCPCKCHPYPPFNLACLIFAKEWIERAEVYQNNPQLWKGTKEKTAWQLMYNAWNWSNTSFETGYYAHFYKEESEHE